MYCIVVDPWDKPFKSLSRLRMLLWLCRIYCYILLELILFFSDLSSSFLADVSFISALLCRVLIGYPVSYSRTSIQLISFADNFSFSRFSQQKSGYCSYVH